MYSKTIIRLVWFLALLLPLISNGQANGDFSNHTCTSSSHVFANGCVSDWQTSHGDASLHSDAIQTDFAWMWSYKISTVTYGEGIFNDFNFQAGKCYQISFRVKVYDDGESQIRNKAVLNLEAINNLSDTTSFSIPNPPQNSRESILAKGYANYPNNSWVTQSAIYTPSSNYSQVWIYPRYDGPSINQGQAELSVDDIVIREVEQKIDASFTDNVYCAPDGTISIEVTSNDNARNHWYGIFETNTPNSTSGGSYITHVTGGPNFTTHTFTGLSRTKNYYIKHGLYGNCTSWAEYRKAYSGEVLWSPRTADFSFDTLLVSGSNLSVKVSSAPNGVSVNHWWAVFQSNNGSISGNNIVPGSTVQFGNPTTFNNLQINTWYFIKHGITNDCAGWIEKRRAFRVQISNKSTESETPTYVIEEAAPAEFRLTPEYIEQTEEALKTYPFYVAEQTGVGISDVVDELRTDIRNPEPAIELYPNPAKSGITIQIKSPALKIKSLSVTDFAGNPYEVPVKIASEHETQITSIQHLTKGIYIVRIETADGSFTNKRMIVE
ncbi:MAG: T9SS type A sorting domain-containing protein [Bacteroidota bacterium]